MCPTDEQNPVPGADDVGALRDRIEDLEATCVALRRAATRAQHLLAHTPAITYARRADGDFGTTYISPNCETQLGHAPEVLIEDPGLWARSIHPDDAAGVSVGLERLLADGQHTHTYRVRNARGEWRWMRDDATLLSDADGVPLEIIGSLSDVTARKEADDQLRAALKLNDDILRCAEEGIIVLDTDLRYRVWNRFMEEISGYPASQVIGRHADELFPFLRATGLMDRVERALAGEHPGPIEFPYPLPESGRNGWTIETTRPLRGHDGRIIGALTMVREITAQRRTELALRESESHYRRIVETTSEGVSSIDLEGTVVYCNEQFARMVGYPVGEVIGRPAASFLWPDEIESHVLGLSAMRRGVGGRAERRFKTRDGRELWLLVSSTASLDAAGHQTGAFAMMTDITDRRKAEHASLARAAELDEAQRLARIGSWEWMTDGDTLQWSAGVFRILGRDPALGAPAFGDLQRHYTRASWSRLEPAVQRAVTHGDAYELELDMLRSDGTICPTMTRGEPVRGPDGAVVRLRGTVKDISEHKRAERELLLAKDAAEAASRAKDEFLANVSHEIRTPMNAVLGFTSLAMDGPLEPEARAYLAVAQRRGHDLVALIDDILDFAKLSSDAVALERAPFDPAQSVRDVVQALSLEAQRKGLTLVAEADPAVPPSVLGDGRRVSQIVTNLATNAVKFTAHGQVRVGVAVAATEVGAARAGYPLVFTVTDTGPGIPPDKREFIFAPFTQVNSSATRAHGGVGLGLAICRRLATQMGGTIDVESELGQGSRFRFAVTLDAALAPDVPTSSGPAAMTSRAAAVAAVRVLVVDDDATSRLLVRAVLQRAGCEVAEAGSGERGVELCVAREFDLVLMDMNMPGMSGIAACAHIRSALAEKARPCPVIVALTAAAMPEDRERFQTAGLDGYLTKPTGRDALLDAVRRVRTPLGS